MQLLYPIGLLALAGLIIPVLIHLWSVKKGKTLKIGSITLLGESANATSRSFRITDWLLFILRCLLLIIVGFLIAQPIFQKKISSKNQMGWILVDQNQFANNVYANHQKTIDSLLTLGFELHDFNFGFKQFELKDSLQKTSISTLSYQSLFKKLNKTIPNGYAAYLFAPKRLNDFEGDLTTINYKLKWFDVKTTDSLKTWTTNFLGKKYEAKSSPTLTSYTSNATQDLPPLVVMIAETKGNDSKYVKAALKTIGDYTKRKIEIKEFNANLKADLTFWLSEQQIPAGFLNSLQPNAKVLVYVNGKNKAVKSTLQIANADAAPIDLFQRIEAEVKPGEVIWKDGFGDPLLVNQELNQVNYFYFYSKFNPQWSDLVWGEQFVNALLPIVLGDQSAVDFGFETNDHDQRVLGTNQNLLLNNNQSNAVTTRVENIGIANYLWLLALLVLIVERILSFRKTRISDVKN